MCESDVWARYPNGESEKIADDVLYVTQEGEEVVLRWFLKEPLRVVGRIAAVDAVKHVVTLEASERPNIEAAQEEAGSHEHEHTHEHGHEHAHEHGHEPYHPH
jgi:predicted RNA-binding protein